MTSGAGWGIAFHIVFCHNASSVHRWAKMFLSLFCQFIKFHYIGWSVSVYSRRTRRHRENNFVIQCYISRYMYKLVWLTVYIGGIVTLYNEAINYFLCYAKIVQTLLLRKEGQWWKIGFQEIIPVNSKKKYTLLQLLCISLQLCKHLICCTWVIQIMTITWDKGFLLLLPHLQPSCSPVESCV